MPNCRAIPPAVDALVSVAAGAWWLHWRALSESDPALCVQYTVDGSAWARSCDSAVRLDAMTVLPKAHDLSLLVDAPTECSVALPRAQLSWWAVTLPELTLPVFTAVPPAFTASLFVTFAFNATSQPACFQCSLDSQAFTPCVSPSRVGPLSLGNHTFAVRVVDAASPDSVGHLIAY